MQEKFKQSLSCFATGVCVVTYRTPTGVDGVTISAFSSLSLNPPKVLFCIGNQGKSKQAFNGVSRFAVSILDSEQKSLAYQFASEDRKMLSEYIVYQDDMPMIKGALSSIICDKGNCYSEGDHDIIIGDVVDIINTNTDLEPLLYFKSTIIEDYCHEK